MDRRAAVYMTRDGKYHALPEDARPPKGATLLFYHTGGKERAERLVASMNRDDRPQERVR